MNSLETGALRDSEIKDILQYSTEYIRRLSKNDQSIEDLRRLVDITSEIAILRNEIDRNIAILRNEITSNIAKKNKKKKSQLIQIKIEQLCAKETERYQICQKLIPILKTDIKKKNKMARSSSGAI